MARKPGRVRGYSIKAGRSASSGYASSQKFHPFGPSMACEIFGVHEYDDYDVCLDEDYESDHVKEHEDEEYWYQTELPLESVREMEQRHLSEIKKFERAYRKMALYALKWHYLMEDLEDNAQLDKMFKDIQLMRKLGGSANV